MPKIKDLGVTVVPEGFGPVGIGGGGGCGVTNPCLLCTRSVTVCGQYTQWACAQISSCTDCTTQAFSICGTTPGGGGGGCSDCTTQAFSICGTTPGPCTDCTTQAFSICGTTRGQCTDCTTQAFSICGTTPQTAAQTGLTVDSIRQLRTALQQQLAALDEAEKAMGPQTEAEIDARETELQQELQSLKSRRQELKNKKE